MRPPFQGNHTQDNRFGSAQGVVQANGSRKSSLTRTIFNNRQSRQANRPQEAGNHTEAGHPAALNNSMGHQRVNQMPPQHQLSSLASAPPAKVPTYCGLDNRPEE